MPRGLFDPDGMYRRVNRETVLLLGGPTALLMQVAHPKVAAGVADHSSYREHPLRRLNATVNAMQSIIYDDKAAALATAERINRMHGQVNGTLKEGTARYPAGTPYSALEPELIVWVYATLTVTTLNVYSTLIRPLTNREAELFYRESRALAHIFGAPDDLVPPDLKGFKSYLSAMIEGNELEITATSRSIALDIVHPPIAGFPRLLDSLVGVPALALLPEPLRERYGLEWTRSHQLAWRSASRLIRKALPLVPNPLRTNKRARRAERQCD